MCASKFSLPELCHAEDLRLRKLFDSFATLPASHSSGGSISSISSTFPPALSIDATRFVKLFRDAGFSNSEVSSVSLDIAFNRARVLATSSQSRAQRRLNYEGFCHAIFLVAQENNGAAVHTSFDDVDGEPTTTICYERLARKLLAGASNGPILRGTVGCAPRLATSYVGANRSNTATGSLNTLASPFRPAIPMKTSMTSRSGGTLCCPISGSGSGLGLGSGAGSRNKESSDSHPTKRSAIELNATVPEIPKGSVFDRLTRKKNPDSSGGSGGLGGDSKAQLGTKFVNKTTNKTKSNVDNFDSKNAIADNFSL